MRSKNTLLLKWLFGLCLICWWMIPTDVSGLAAEDLNSTSAVLMDMKTGQILFEKNADQVGYPASITKILTAIVALESIDDLDQEMYASKKALESAIFGGMHIFIWDDEVLKFKDLLHALLIPSANDAANVIAYNTFGDTQTFLSRMNARALELGAQNTHFTNPSGLHEEDHYTTARDMSLLARHAMSLDLFREIAGKTAYTMEPTNRHAVWDTLNASNTFLYATSDYFSRVTGIKTGYTNKAGFTLAASAQNDQGWELLSVTMGAASRSASNKDAKTLLEYGFLNFEQVSAASKAALLATAPVQKSKQPLDILLSEDVTLLKHKDEPLALTYELRLDEALTAPVEAGQIVGSADYFNNGVLVANVPVMAAGGVNPESGLLPLVKSLLNIILGSLLLGAMLILFFRIRYRSRLRRRMRRAGVRLTAMPYMSVSRRKKNRSGWI